MSVIELIRTQMRHAALAELPTVQARREFMAQTQSMDLPQTLAYARKVLGR